MKSKIHRHNPSTTAEKHYRVRLLDLLRGLDERIEAWILEQAKIEVQTTSTKLRVVA